MPDVARVNRVFGCPGNCPGNCNLQIIGGDICAMPYSLNAPRDADTDAPACWEDEATQTYYRNIKRDWSKEDFRFLLDPDASQNLVLFGELLDLLAINAPNPVSHEELTRQFGKEIAPGERGYNWPMRFASTTRKIREIHGLDTDWPLHWPKETGYDGAGMTQSNALHWLQLRQEQRMGA
jgi:hypothetical protein